jgi:hypothetical protein
MKLPIKISILVNVAVNVNPPCETLTLNVILLGYKYNSLFGVRIDVNLGMLNVVDNNPRLIYIYY